MAVSTHGYRVSSVALQMLREIAAGVKNVDTTWRLCIHQREKWWTVLGILFRRTWCGTIIDTCAPRRRLVADTGHRSTRTFFLWYTAKPDDGDVAR